MKLIITYCSICIFLCAGLFTKAQESSEHLFREAEILLAREKLTDAYILYERIAFETVDPQITNRALFMKANVLKQKEEYLQAQRSLERLDFSVMSDSFQFIVRYETALCAYLEGNFYDAISQFEQLSFYVRDSSLLLTLVPLQVLVYNEIQDWSKSRDLLEKYYKDMTLSDSAKILLNEIIDFYTRKNIPKLKKVKRAQLLSMFVPGLGQMYAGYVGEGLLNFTLTFASLGLAGVAFWYKYYFTGYFAGLALFQKFYFGANRRLEYLVNKRNYLNTRKFNDEVKSRLLHLQRI
jgi:TM2 domain-containing membrane protein YozV